MSPPGLEQSRDIRHCHPYIRERWPELLARYAQATGQTLFLTCTYRSTAVQQRLFAQGRTAPGPVVTWVDGVKRLSMHNLYPAWAFDVAVDLDPDIAKVKVSWDWRNYKPLVEICQEIGLVSGGSWRKKDWPHIEIPAGLV